VGRSSLQLLGLVRPCFSSDSSTRCWSPAASRRWTSHHRAGDGFGVQACWLLAHLHILPHPPIASMWELGARLFPQAHLLPLNYFQSAPTVRAGTWSSERLGAWLEAADGCHAGQADPALIKPGLPRQAPTTSPPHGADWTIIEPAAEMSCGEKSRGRARRQLHIEAIGGVGEYVGAQAAQQGLEHRNRHPAR